MTRVVRTLQGGKIDAPCLLLQGLREHAEPRSREAVAWRLVEQWQNSGAPMRDAWALHGVGLLGGDESALKLTAMIRDSSGRSGRHRAWQALQSLPHHRHAPGDPASGGPVAVAALKAVARTGPLAVRGGGGAARPEPNRTGGWRGAVIGLRHGRRAGIRFRLALFPRGAAAGLRLLLRDDAGQLREDLPAVGKRDDVDLGRRATMEWRLLKQQVPRLLQGAGRPAGAGHDGRPALDGGALSHGDPASIRCCRAGSVAALGPPMTRTAGWSARSA